MHQSVSLKKNSLRNMDFTAICRTCLNNNSLNPIFVSEEHHERYASAIYLCTGIQVQLNDGLPQHMCMTCMNQVNSILKFRKQCKEVETQLYTIKIDLIKPIKSNTVPTLNVTKNIKELDEVNDNENVKIEPYDIDENQPLKLFVNKHTSNNSLRLCKKLNTKPYSKTEILDNTVETENTNDDNDDEHFSSIEKSLQGFDSPTDQTDNETNTNVYSETDLQSTTEANLTDIIGRDVPYNVITESVTKTTRVICKICQKELSIRSIDTHMARRHPGADERKVKCDFCDKYVLREKLNRHRIMTHGNAGFRCGYCKSELNSKELLVDHVATCTAKKRKRKTNDSGRAMAECDVCHKTMQRASIRMHKAVKHAGLRPVCEHCGKSFGNKFRLNEHYRAKHGYEKFQCTYCDFRSAGIMAMRNHERRHRGEKPFICEACGAKFHAAYLLTQHKHSHRTEKLVKCDLCPASFKANNSLHMHKLTCHSKSVYRCTICSRSYKCRYYAVKHARLAHSVTGTPPVIKLMT